MLLGWVTIELTILALAIRSKSDQILKSCIATIALIALNTLIA